MTVHVTGLGTYLPDVVLTGADIAARTDIPEAVVVEKMGVRQKHVCPPDEDHPAEMCVAAAEDALADAALRPDELDAVRYHGSEFKDYVVWNAAAAVAHTLGADGASATESYALCAGLPVALREARALLDADAGMDRILLVAASREEDLVDYDDPDTSFMFNFGSGATALVLEADAPDRALARVRESASLTDGSFSEDVVMPAGGTRRPPSEDSVANGDHALRVPDHERMKRRLGEVSLPNFRQVADEALDRSGYDRADVDFAAITHMKRSFHETLCENFGLGPDDHLYLDEYGHVQSCDQGLALDEARDDLTAGDVVLCLAAGTGYTWAASVLEWCA
ncbi:3-oxoacyl-ACP synthase [Haloarcula pellucida]|uniref:3-oxoacyl-[acyl-carrier-protein] synthase 3 n=1 Tax=Haloarcula pellucida TaxID=1427151 RepID=A0A830GJR7_9EURY|nr:3-oxoacyl-ACP synthase [Halomicroarcula pellucida]MBX0347459.1 3-oxoacyl-ACP synthase [Halomicroarcula pellucida]GGN88781.1 3-oxoacyl-[acyl-carrier-protein] synthase 3 [Halomicroarcula pellucida]